MKLLNDARALFPLLAVVVASCSSSSTPDGGADAGADAATVTCTRTLTPSADAADTQTVVQTALVEASAGDVLCFDDGVYAFTKELSLTGRGVTLRATHSRQAILEFRGQEATARNGLLVTADDFTIEGFVIKNTAGDGIRVEGAKNVAFKDLRVLWEMDAWRPDKDGVPRSGAYAVYPVGCDGILIENTEVTDARDAGLYVGQSKNAVVRNNVVHASVAGIELENTTDSDVHDNDVYDNTAGILVFNLPDLPVQDGKRAKVHDNKIRENNHENFGIPGTIVAGVPKGLGVLILAADDTDLSKNTFTGNGSTGVLIVSCRTNNNLKDCTSSVPYNQFAVGTWIHENVFENNGTAPDPLVGALIQNAAGTPIESILWDGDVDPTDARKPLCIKNNVNGTVRNFNAPNGYQNQSTDPAPYDCDLSDAGL